MISLDINPSNVTAWGVVAFGILLNAGAFSFWVKNATDMRLMGRDMDDLKLKQAMVLKDSGDNKLAIGLLASRVNQQEVLMSEIRNHMVKLDTVPEAVSSLVTSAEFIKQTIQNIVPRVELDARLKSTDDRVTTVEHEIKELKDK
jgi:hypothetical protein